MRRPSVGRLIALTGVTVTSLLSIDTTMACRFLWRHHRVCDTSPMIAPCAAPAATTCCWEDPAPVIHSAPVECCASEPIVNTCCSGGEVYLGETIVGESYIGGETILGDDTIIGESAPHEASDAVPTPAPTTTDTPAVTPAANAADDKDEASPEETPSDDDSSALPGDDAAAGATDAEADAPAFGEADALPDDMPADDLDALSAPADEPAVDAPPAETPAEDDALPGFDEPADAPPADAPADDPAAPAEEGDSLDDLFSSKQSGEATSEARTARQTEELPAADDLFDAPAKDAPASGDAPAAPAEDSKTVDDLDDLFGFREASPAPVTAPVATQVDRPEFRVWTDNTGRFRTVGKLVKISESHVRLLKDNNRYSTVAKDRLSQADLAYIDQHQNSMGVESFDQVARR